MAVLGHMAYPTHDWNSSWWPTKYQCHWNFYLFHSVSIQNANTRIDVNKKLCLNMGYFSALFDVCARMMIWYYVFHCYAVHWLVYSIVINHLSKSFWFVCYFRYHRSHYSSWTSLCLVWYSFYCFSQSPFVRQYWGLSIIYFSTSLYVICLKVFFSPSFSLIL